MEPANWYERVLGQTLRGRYRVDAAIGAGGMGAVFRARHLGLNRDVALKLLIPKLLESGESVQRFRREAQAAASVSGHGAIEVLDYDIDPTHGPFLVMELLTGESLDRRITSRGRLDPAEALPILDAILGTLQAVHAAGVIHRDLKPANVFLAMEGGRETVKILDFGVVRLVRAEFRTQLTRPGMAVGSPTYMAPEQARADADVDARVDVYAAGAILYVALAGVKPYAGLPGAVLQALVNGPPPSLATYRPDLPAEVVRYVETLMAWDRRKRFPSAEAARAALQTLLPVLSGSYPPAPVALPPGSRGASAAPAPLSAPSQPPTVAAISVSQAPPRTPSLTPGPAPAPPPPWGRRIALVAAALALAGGAFLAGRLAAPEAAAPPAPPAATPTPAEVRPEPTVAEGTATPPAAPCPPTPECPATPPTADCGFHPLPVVRSLPDPLPPVDVLGNLRPPETDGDRLARELLLQLRTRRTSGNLVELVPEYLRVDHLLAKDPPARDLVSAVHAQAVFDLADLYIELVAAPATERRPLGLIEAGERVGAPLGTALVDWLSGLPTEGEPGLFRCVFLRMARIHEANAAVLAWAVESNGNRGGVAGGLAEASASLLGAAAETYGTAVAFEGHDAYDCGRVAGERKAKLEARRSGSSGSRP